MNKPTFGRVALVIILTSMVAWTLLNLERLNVDSMVTWIAGTGVLAPLVFAISRTLGAVIFVPGSIMAIAAGVLFGLTWGAIYNLIASTTGAVLAFSVARYLAPGWVAHRIAGHDRLTRLIEGVEAEGWRFVAFVRLVPLFPYNILNYALGLTRIRTLHFTLASLVCMIPGDIAYVYMGYAGREAIAGNEAAWQMGLIALGLLAALAFIPRLVRQIRRR